MISSVIDNLKLKKNKKVPIWLMRQAGRYMNDYHIVKSKFSSFITMCKNEDALTEITLQPIKKFDFDAAIIFSDILLILDAININVEFIKDKGPLVKSPVNLSEINSLPNTLNPDSVNPCYNAIKNIKKELQDKPLIGFAAAPWTLATYYIEGSISKDLSRIKSFSYLNVKHMDYVVSLFSNLIIKHLVNQVEAGVDILQIFDTHAYQMDHKMHQRYAIAPLKEISKRVKKIYPNIPIIYYTKAPILTSFNIENYVDCLSLSSNINLKIEKNKIKKKFCFQGNLDPALLVAGGKLMKEEATSILKDMEEEYFIFNLGHGVLPETPPKNVYDLIEVVKKFNR